MAKKGQGETKILATAIALATGTMAPRLLLQVAIVNSALARQLAIPLIILGLTPIIIALILIWRGIEQKEKNVPIELSNPIEIGIALQYALILITLSLLIEAGQQWFGQTGVYLISGLSGLADVDAVSISLARAVNQTMPLSVAKVSIFIAVFMNTVVKVILTRLIGGRELARWCAMIVFATLTISGLIILI
jgi:uncharacterized membrane protein (DUF4010 family)